MLIYLLCICLYISEMNDSNDTGERKQELELFCYYKVLTLPMSGIMLFESGLGLIVISYKCIYCKL